MRILVRPLVAGKVVELGVPRLATSQSAQPVSDLRALWWRGNRRLACGISGSRSNAPVRSRQGITREIRQFHRDVKAIAGTLRQ